MSKLPERIRQELEKLIKDELPPKQIAFMMKLSPRVVEAEIKRLDETRQQAGAGR